VSPPYLEFEHETACSKACSGDVWTSFFNFGLIAEVPIGTPFQTQWRAPISSLIQVLLGGPHSSPLSSHRAAAR
jgi:hypothetical protein